MKRFKTVALCALAGCTLLVSCNRKISRDLAAELVATYSEIDPETVDVKYVDFSWDFSKTEGNKLKSNVQTGILGVIFPGQTDPKGIKEKDKFQITGDNYVRFAGFFEEYPSKNNWSNDIIKANVFTSKTIVSTGEGKESQTYYIFDELFPKTDKFDYSTRRYDLYISGTQAKLEDGTIRSGSWHYNRQGRLVEANIMLTGDINSENEHGKLNCSIQVKAEYNPDKEKQS